MTRRAATASKSASTPTMAGGKLGEVRAPRYTSYPTAPMFGRVKGAEFGGWLRAIPRDVPDDDKKNGMPLSLYFHVPFCRELCWFCGCHTTITPRREPVARFLDTLLAEIDLAAAELGSGHVANHVHFGGGSPTILTGADFTELMAHVRKYITIAPDAEVAVEMDPRTLNAENIAAFAAAGVNRASLGIQDFAPEVQEAVHRVQPLEKVIEVIDLLRAAGITSINMDLMYGLPKQTPEGYRATIERAITFSPARIAMFSYAHVPWMKKHQEMIDETKLPPPEDRIRMREIADRMFLDAGYIAVGMDHYAHPNDTLAEAARASTLHRNFQGYTVDAADALVAFGPSAISRVPSGYAQNEPNLKAWHDAILGGKLASVKGHALTDDDRLFGAVIERLMCDYRADLAEIAADHGVSVTRFADALAALIPLANEGLVKLVGTTVSVKTDIPAAVRLVSACFDQYMKTAEAAYSKVV